MRTAAAKLKGRLANLLGQGPADGTAGPTVATSLTADELALIEECRPYTMVSPERLMATVDAVTHIVRRDVPGALVECGVWRGGSVLGMIRTLQRLGVADREVYLCDTFTGMTAPSAEDISAFDPPAFATYEAASVAGDRAWSGLFGEGVFGLEQVQTLIEGTGYPSERVHFVVGDVLETIPDGAPDVIAVLRLDTDWYDSTSHELEHLYPRLARGGVLIIDDYGHWQGAKKAFDEYFASRDDQPLLSRTDYTGRMGVKV